MELKLSPEDLDHIAELVAVKILERLPKADDGKLLTEQEAAAQFSVTVHTLRDARRRKVLECTRIGRFPRYSRAQLNAWLSGKGATE